MQDAQKSNDEAPPATKRRTPWANLAMLCVSLLLPLLLIELGYRLANGLPVFALTDWRAEQVSLIRLRSVHIVPDPVLGWTNAPWASAGGFDTIDHGIRRNFDETTVRTGAVLVTGDSYVEGWEVENHESWPAVLEETTGIPVVNAGVGAHGTDQVILRTEQLLPIVKPKILVIGFTQDGIFRSEYSRFGAPKPYFTMANGELAYHPPEPLEPREPGGALSSIAYWLRGALGYLAAADYVFARLARDLWYGAESQMFRKADNNPVNVTCALLRRLAVQTEKEGIRTILFMQYDARHLVSSTSPMRESLDIMDCARQAGMRVADQFAGLQAAIVTRGRDPIAMLTQYYVFFDGMPGHMSARGNRHAAQLLATELRDWLAALPDAQ